MLIGGIKFMMKNDIMALNQIAKQLRIDIIETLYKSQSGHPGGSLSAVEILTALYFEVMNINPKNPELLTRDRFILSKGHAAPVLYVTLAQKGYFFKEELKTLRQLGSILQGHPDMKKTPGVDFSSGSLGQGLSVGCGMAIGSKLNNINNYVFVLLGDGELNEGQVWEAAMAAAKFKLDNLIAIVDYNKVQLDGTTDEIMPLEPLVEKWKAFNWNVYEVDGHNIKSILESINEAKQSKGAPSVIIARTIKGKGVSFMENMYQWHGKPINEVDFMKARQELGGK